MRNLVILAAILICACHASPTDPSQAQSCSIGCDGVLRPLDSAAERAAMEAEAETMRAEIERGTLVLTRPVSWSFYPRVEYRACPWWVEGAAVYGSTCASGECRYDDGKIVVATNENERRVPLVRWEYRNFKLIEGGRRDLAR